jgi:uncharacterized protein (DUF1697 family)
MSASRPGRERPGNPDGRRARPSSDAERHVALLRGINVGRAKRVAMADLRALVESLGYRDVRTLLNSGNVVFSVPAGSRGDPARRIEDGIARRLGVTCRVVVLRAAELAAMIAESTLAAAAEDFSRLLVFVLADPADRSRLEGLAAREWKSGALFLGRRAAHAWCPEGLLDSELAVALGRVLGDRVTSRNWATLLKLDALVRDSNAGQGGGTGSASSGQKTRVK